MAVLRPDAVSLHAANRLQLPGGCPRSMSALPLRDKPLGLGNLLAGAVLGQSLKVCIFPKAVLHLE
jgi:hypothetical protein